MNNILDYLVDQKEKQRELNFAFDLNVFHAYISNDLKCYKLEENKISSDLFKISKNKRYYNRMLIYLDLYVCRIYFKRLDLQPKDACIRQINPYFLYWNNNTHINSYYENFYILLEENLDLIIKETINPSKKNYLKIMWNNFILLLFPSLKKF